MPKLIQILSITFLLLPLGSLNAQELSFQKDCVDELDIKSITAPYATENCPDLPIIGACINMRGLSFTSAPKDENSDPAVALEQIENFFDHYLPLCSQACGDGDGGACFILSQSHLQDIKRYTSLESAGSKLTLSENVTNIYNSVLYSNEACGLDIAPACSHSGSFIKSMFWDEMQQSLITSKQCWGEDRQLESNNSECTWWDESVYYAAQNGLTLGSPIPYFDKGCALGHALSCGQALDFGREHPELVGADFDEDYYLAHICKLANELLCEKYTNK